MASFRESVTNKKIGNRKIYHIASHAEVNLEDPGSSFILFNDGNSEKLLAQDIYTLDVNDSFVVLSACETRIDTLETGQGKRIFFQAFRYAGATSLLHSKWKVSNQSTAFIISAFYEQLAQGKLKDIALQQAKINYLIQASRCHEQDSLLLGRFCFNGRCKYHTSI